MEEIKKSIIKHKPKLKDSSIKAYIFNLLKLHEKLTGNKDIKNLDFLKDSNKILDVLKELKISSRKTYLASIVVALSTDEDKYKKPLEEYRKVMMEHISKYNADIIEQQKSETQQKNWTTMASIKKVVKKYKKDLLDRNIFKKNKEDITKREMDLIQKWMVGSLYVLDDENPPPRNDFTPMKIISYNNYIDTPDDIKKNNNYLVIQSRNKKFFSLGEYKTDKVYGLKKINLGNKLNSVINIYQKFNPGEYLIYNSRGEAMTPNGLTKYLNKIFEPTGKKNISSTMLRHIYISEKLGGPTLKEKMELAEKMGHSVSTQETYKKN